MRPSRYNLRASFCGHWPRVLFAAPLLALSLLAQPTSPGPRDPFISLMASGPKIEIPLVTKVSAAFDPPIVRPGEQAFLRVTLSALADSIEWPAKLAAPAQLEIRQGARQQILQYTATNLEPRTACNYRVRSSGLGSFTVPEFAVKVDGKPVTVPSAQIQVVAEPPASVAPATQLSFALPATNLFVGQAIQVSIALPMAGGGAQTLMQPQVSGAGLLVDQSTVHQHFQMVSAGGTAVPTFIYEVTFTPMTAGKFPVFAHGFTVGRHLPAPVVTNSPVPVPPALPVYTLIESDPVELDVRPLPRLGELPGFTGAIGQLTVGQPTLATNVLLVGDPVKLTVAVTNRGDGPLARVVSPPPPHVPDWQVLLATDYAAAQPVPLQQPALPLRPGLSTPAGKVAGVVTFSYILVPLSAAARATPPIPFSCFDSKTLRYVDVTIPPVSVTVRPGATSGDLATLTQAEPTGIEPDKELRLRGLAVSRGRTASSLAPPQQQAWFPLVQLAPALGFFGLWRWDRRRRYLEQHPDIILRRRARRALHRQRRILRQAARAADSPRYAAAAVNAMRVACAPHYPAEPRALVGSDVLPLLSELERAGRAGEVVRRFFIVADATCFGAVRSANAAELLPLQPDLERVLEQLEQKL